MQQMDNIFNAVNVKFGKKMDEIWSSEMTIGGDTLYGRDSEGAPTSSWFQYDCERVPADCKLRRHAIESFVRRQSIWIIAQGDPMDTSDIRVDHAWVVVGGPDILLTLK
jgi:hypothetical protein